MDAHLKCIPVQTAHRDLNRSKMVFATPDIADSNNLDLQCVDVAVATLTINLKIPLRFVFYQIVSQNHVMTMK